MGDRRGERRKGERKEGRRGEFPSPRPLRLSLPLRASVPDISTPYSPVTSLTRLSLIILPKHHHLQPLLSLPFPSQHLFFFIFVSCVCVMYLLVWRPEINARYLSCLALHLFFFRVSLWTWSSSIWLRLTDQWTSWIYLSSQSPWCWGYRYVPLHLTLYKGLGDLNSGPHAYAVTSWPTETTSPAPIAFQYFLHSISYHLKQYVFTNFFQNYLIFLHQIMVQWEQYASHCTENSKQH